MTSKRTHAVFLRTSTAPARRIVIILAYPTIARTQQHTILSENSKSKIMIRSASSSLARSAVARQVYCHARRAPSSSSSSSSALLSLSTSHTTQQSVSTVSHRNFSTTMDIMSLNYGVEPLEDQIIKTFSDHTVRTCTVQYIHPSLFVRVVSHSFATTTTTITDIRFFIVLYCVYDRFPSLLILRQRIWTPCWNFLAKRVLRTMWSLSPWTMGSNKPYPT